MCVPHNVFTFDPLVQQTTSRIGDCRRCVHVLNVSKQQKQQHPRMVERERGGDPLVAQVARHVLAVQAPIFIRGECGDEDPDHVELLIFASGRGTWGID